MSFYHPLYLSRWFSVEMQASTVGILPLSFSLWAPWATHTDLMADQHTVGTHAHTNLCAHIHIDAHTHVCILCMHTSECVYVFVYIHSHTHTHTHIEKNIF